jgi:hypothetical protein
MTSSTTYESAPVNVRIKISALWTTMLFVFAYVDIFGFFRSDLQAQIAAGKLSVGFAISQTFLLLTTVYVAVPSLMVFLTLILRPRLTRVLNMVLGILYVVTIVGQGVDEWTYYNVGSIIEVIALGVIAFYAWSWPKQAPANRPVTR